MTEAIGQSVGHTARNLGIQTIVAATESGHTARMISKYRPKSTYRCNYVLRTKKARSLSLSWGVYATVADKPSSTDEMFNLASKVSQEEGYASEGDLIIITRWCSSWRKKGTTNLMKIQMIGSKLVQGQGVGEEAIIAKSRCCGNC